MHTLPTLSAISNSPSDSDSPLTHTLSILFEASPILTSKLEPQVAEVISKIPPLSSYSDLIDTALSLIESWDIPSKSSFIAGHPRIGETKNLSDLSAKEQGSSPVAPTSPEVLDRLAHLNHCYETKYPGLRYITFVNGRTRGMIVEEMEDLLGFEHSLDPREPRTSNLRVVCIDDDEWKAELQSAIQNVGLIAKSRLKALGVQ